MKETEPHNLEEIFAPIGLASFLESSWGRDLRHLSGEPGRFAGLLSWDQLSALLEHVPLLPPRVRLVKRGVEVAEQRYVQRGEVVDRLDPGRLALELEHGATLIINFIDELVPVVGKLADQIGEALRVAATINLYASWREDNGLPLHADHHGVLVLQLSGCKRWTVYRAERSHPLPGEPLTPPPAGAEPLWCGSLTDGDVLYVPHGYPHVASATDGPSLHLTISLERPNGIGFVRWLVKELRDDAGLRGPIPDDETQRVQWLDQLRATISSSINEHAARTYRQFPDGREPVRSHFVLPAFSRRPPQEWDSSTRLRVASARRLELRFAADGSSRLRIGERDWPVGPDATTRLARLEDRSTSTLGELQQGLGNSEAGELRRLLALLLATGQLFAEP